MVFGSFVTAIRRFRSSAIRRNGSRQTDKGKGFECKPEKNRRRGSVSARPFCVDCQQAGKNARGGHVFVFDEKMPGYGYTLSYSTFYAKKVL